MTRTTSGPVGLILSPHSQAGDMTAPTTIATRKKESLISGIQWYGPRPPGAGYDRPSTASREDNHGNRWYWFGLGEICFRDSRRRRSWEDGAAQDASPS